MATLVWDKVGERYFQTGVDRGVLYLIDGTAIPWNGLTGVEENTARDVRSFFLDGVKYLDSVIPGDFSGRLRALTYPDEFDAVNGIVDVSPGMSYHDQPGQFFHLSYRTKIGNDLEGLNHGYKIHLLYNLVANSDVVGFETVQDPVTPLEFAWALSGIPPSAEGRRPTVHISIDSTKTDPRTLEIIEDILYGSEISDPRIPPLDELTDLFASLGALIIIDNGDGTWTAIDLADAYITMLDDTTFQIDNADATYINISTYQISSTFPD